MNGNLTLSSPISQSDFPVPAMADRQSRTGNFYCNAESSLPASVRSAEFHILGPATENACLPRVVRVCGIFMVNVPEDLVKVAMSLESEQGPETRCLV